MSISFLLQATRVLHVGNYGEDEINMIYDFLQNVDNDDINEYNSKCSVLSYENDLELFIEIINATITILEKMEEYEKCGVLLNKKQECLSINSKKQKLI